MSNKISDILEDLSSKLDEVKSLVQKDKKVATNNLSNDLVNTANTVGGEMRYVFRKFHFRLFYRVS